MDGTQEGAAVTEGRVAATTDQFAPETIVLEHGIKRGATVLAKGKFPVCFHSEDAAVRRAQHYRGFGYRFKAVPSGGSAWYLEVE